MKKLIALLIMLVMSLLVLASCSSSGSSSSSSSGGYKYGTRESYDSKYGAGSYDADKQLLDSMRDAWNNGH